MATTTKTVGEGGGSAPATAGQRRIDFLKRAVRAGAVLGLIFGLGYVGVRVGILPDIELNALDVQMRLNQPLADTPVRVVHITDRDYKEHFHNNSPLDPAVVYRLIDAVARGEPKVIGVDLDTSDPVFANFQPSPSWPPVVWARKAKMVDRKWQPEPFLGGRTSGLCSGVASLRPESDWLIRRYRRTFGAEDLRDPRPCAGAPASDGEGGCAATACPIPSFARAVLSEYDKRFSTRAAPRDHPEGLSIRLAAIPQGEQDEPPTLRDGLRAGDILRMAAPGAPERERVMLKTVLGGRIVLLGGSYEAARDVHPTPVGGLAGVEINAQIIETEYFGLGVPPPHWRAVAVLLLFENIFLIFIFRRFHDDKLYTLLMSLGLLIVLSVLCSLAAFGTVGQWAYFLPVLLIILLLEFYDRAKEYRNQLLNGSGGRAEPASLHGGGPAGPSLPPWADFSGTLDDYVSWRLSELREAYERTGHRVVREERTPFSTSLKQTGVKLEIDSELGGRLLRREFFFFEGADTEKLIVEQAAPKVVSQTLS